MWPLPEEPRRLFALAFSIRIAERAGIVDWWFLLADTGPSTDGIATIVATAGSGGFAIWYAWYTTTRVIPEKETKHSTQVEKLIESFEGECKEQRELFRDECEAQRAMHREEMGKLWAEVKEMNRIQHEETATMRNAFHELKTELRNKV